MICQRIKLFSGNTNLFCDLYNKLRYDCVAYATEVTTLPCQLTIALKEIKKSEEGKGFILIRIFMVIIMRCKEGLTFENEH